MKIIIIVLAMMVLSMVGVASAEPYVNVSSQTTDAKLGDVFTVNITADPKGDERIYAASYDLYFDATVLEATEQTQGDFLGQGGVGTDETLNRINNTRGKIVYVETRTGDVGGATEPGVIASINFTVIGIGISDLTLKDVQLSDYELNNIDVSTTNGTVTVSSPQQPSFLIYGRVCYTNGSSCSNPSVSITNLNTGEEWDANISSSNHYYITLTAGVDLNASEILQFNVTDGMKSCVFINHTITADEVNACGLFNFNLQVLCKGDVDGNGIINIMDVRLLANHVSNPEEYPIGTGCDCKWAGDIDDIGGINMADVQLLLGHVFKA